MIRALCFIASMLIAAVVMFGALAFIEFAVSLLGAVRVVA